MTFRSLLTLSIAAVVAAPGLAQDAPAALKAQIAKASAVAMDRNPSLEYNPYTVMVKFRPTASPAQKSMARFQVAGKTLDRFAVVPGLEVMTTQVDPVLAAQWLNGMPGVEYAEVDHIVRHDLLPNDPSFSSLWGLRNTGQSGGLAGADIKAAAAWDVYTGNDSTVVAVIDSGVQRTHPDLLANSWVNPGEIPGNGIDDDANGLVDDMHGWDFVNNDADPADDNSHGTHCAGTIGGVGNNGVGVTGVAWKVKIVGLKFLGANGSGSTSNAVKAVDYCFKKGIRISNNSWGGGGYSSSLYNAINNSKSIGHLFIAAAGNSARNNDSTAHYPSSYDLDNVVAVASFDRLDAMSSFSNYGATSVDLGAPGSSIYSTVLNSLYGSKSGTSMATPHVAGAAALLLSYRPGWTYQQLRDALYSNVRLTSAMSGKTVTGGVLNIGATMAYAQALPNNAPSVTISAPSNNASYNQGALVSFSASAVDAEHGVLSGQLSWSSSLSGSLGSGASWSSSTLAPGTHTITASVTDPGGLTGSKSVQLVIVSPIPAAPSNLQGARTGRGYVTLTWSDNSNNETGFEIERQPKIARTGSWGTPVIIQAAVDTSTKVISVGSDVSRFRIRAVNASGASAWTGYVEY